MPDNLDQLQAQASQINKTINICIDLLSHHGIKAKGRHNATIEEDGEIILSNDLSIQIGPDYLILHNQNKTLAESKDMNGLIAPIKEAIDLANGKSRKQLDQYKEDIMNRTVKELKASAEELKTIMNFEEAVPSKKADIENYLKEGAKVIVATDLPQLTPSTIGCIKGLGCELPEAPAPELDPDIDTPTKKETVPRKDKKVTRAETFKAIMDDDILRTKKEIAAEMMEQYGGSENEANFQTDTFARILITMGFASLDDDKHLIMT